MSKKHNDYKNSTEFAIGNGYEVVKIVKLKGKLIRYYLFKGEETDHLKYLRRIAPEEAEDIEYEELYFSFRSWDVEYYREVKETLESKGISPEEIDVDEGFIYGENMIRKLIDMKSD